MKARCETLELSARFLSAALQARGQKSEAPKLSGDVFENIAALENHCTVLESKLAALPAENATDSENVAALQSERDQWKAKAEKFEAEIAGLKTEIEGMSAKYSRELNVKLAAKLVEHGINHSERFAPPGANAQGRKPTATEKLLSARGANSLAQLQQTSNQKTAN